MSTKFKIILVLLLQYTFSYSQAPTVSLTSVITGFDNPLQVTHAADNTNRLYVLSQKGHILVYDKNYIYLDTFFRITGIPTNNEQGLLSVVFHPNYRVNGYFYVRYTAANNAIIISRYTRSASNVNRADLSTGLILLNIPHQFSNHNAGEMHFGKDGYLYISNGDSGSGGDPNSDGQNPNSLLAKMLRINVDVASSPNNYSIPAGNPIAGSPVYCLGLRNPFRWSFDRSNDDAYIGDVGQNAREELSYIPSKDMSGANFGWKCYEGNNTYSNCNPLPSNYKSPVFTYPTVSGDQSVIGGQVYRGYKYPDLKGWYFFIDYYNSNLRKIDRRVATNPWTVTIQNISISSITDFGESEDGEVFITTQGTGTIYQLTHANSKTVYTFTGSGDWMTASNWKGAAVPPNPLPSGSVIVIKPYTGGFCEINVNRTISTGADIFVEPRASFRVGATLQVD